IASGDERSCSDQRPRRYESASANEPRRQMSAEIQNQKTGSDDPRGPVLPPGRSAVPVWMIVALAILGYGGLVQLNDYGGGFQPAAYEPYNSVSDEMDAWPVPEGGDPRVGRRIFETYCQVCHQATGLGMPGQFPPLAGSEWVLAPVPNKIIRIVLNGATGPFTVKGQPFNNTMVPWRDTLKDDEIAAVLTFIRGNKDWGNNAPPVKPADVRAIRDKTADKGGAWTMDDLMKLGDKD
ncbi:MAG TPA: cytochrome c, partial [Verrucomicrobiae bacterium]|nr:cytochrome c [Verrucomicrobiae bacterium]